VAATLTRRQLNRATLARQMLLARERVGVAEAVERLGGLQAQEPRPPFAGLWTRVEGFGREDLHAALHERSLVRAMYLRATLHVTTAGAYAAARPVLAPVMEAAMRGALRTRSEGLDLRRVLPAARRLLHQEPRTFAELRSLLSEAFPDANERALGYAVRTQLRLVMVPTDDRWAFPRASRFALAEDWLDDPPGEGAGAATLLRAYLAAFGPASAADAQTWSGLQGCRAVLESMRPELRVLADEAGRELFDLPGAPRPDDDTPAPPRLLPEFDNLMLAHADRTRVVADEHRSAVVTKNLRVRATFLVDGFVAGTWTVARASKRATLTLAPFAALPRGAERALVTEGEALVRFLEEDATAFDVRVARS